MRNFQFVWILLCAIGLSIKTKNCRSMMVNSLCSDELTDKDYFMPNSLCDEEK